MDEFCDRTGLSGVQVMISNAPDVDVRPGQPDPMLMAFDKFRRENNLEPLDLNYTGYGVKYQ